MMLLMFFPVWAAIVHVMSRSRNARSMLTVTTATSATVMRRALLVRVLRARIPVQQVRLAMKRLTPVRQLPRVRKMLTVTTATSATVMRRALLVRVLRARIPVQQVRLAMKRLTPVRQLPRVRKMLTVLPMNCALTKYAFHLLVSHVQVTFLVIPANCALTRYALLLGHVQVTFNVISANCALTIYASKASVRSTKTVKMDYCVILPPLCALSVLHGETATVRPKFVQMTRRVCLQTIVI